MAGHSKWANIQHRKGAQDKKRAKLFTRLIREIVVAVKEGANPDPDSNPRLRLAMDKALGANMPKDTIERAIKRGAGNAEGENYERVRYEGYGPSGVAVMVDSLTDNRTRTVAEVRHAFSKCGGNLGTDGSVAFIFTYCGVFLFPNGDEEKILEIAIGAGAEDVITDDTGTVEVITTPETFEEVKKALLDAGLEAETAETTMRASNSVSLDQESAEKMLKLLDMLDELDDVQSVYSNADISEEIMANL